MRIFNTKTAPASSNFGASPTGVGDGKFKFLVT
jgi:hypothetical protein